MMFPFSFFIQWIPAHMVLQVVASSLKQDMVYLTPAVATEFVHHLSPVACCFYPVLIQGIYAGGHVHECATVLMASSLFNSSIDFGTPEKPKALFAIITTIFGTGTLCQLPNVHFHVDRIKGRIPTYLLKRV